MDLPHHEHAAILHALGEPCHGPLVMNSIEELLQIEVDHQFVAVFEMLAGFDR